MKNLTAFFQWFFFTIRILITACIIGTLYYFKPIADVSLVHCAGIISQEAELVKKREGLELEITELEQREIDLEAREQSLPVCKKK